MEPEIKVLMMRVVNTLSFGIIWALSNTTAGLMYGYAYINSSITLWNIVYYTWLLFSTIAYLRYLIRIWSQPLTNRENN